MSEPTKKLKPYVVRVRTLGEWWDEYEVQAENSSEAWDNWSDGDKINDDPIGLDGLEFEVDDVKRGDYWGYDDDDYDE